MEIKDIIKFEPIDLTHIAITFGLALIIMYAFKTQLNSFFDSLQNRPITVTMSGSETKIELDAPVKPKLLAESISNPEANERSLQNFGDIQNWGTQVQNIQGIDQFPKLGFEDLYDKLSSLNEGDLAVINYVVDDPGRFYFQDPAMLRYLSVASQKIRYLAFYKDNHFVAMINIQDVISGLASRGYEFADFGEKIKQGQWVAFPHLITRSVSFEQTPSVKDLYQRLADTGLTEIPLLSNGRLIGLLNHRSVSDELYAQVSSH